MEEEEEEEKGTKTRHPAFSTHVAINPLETGDNGPYPRRCSCFSSGFTSSGALSRDRTVSSQQLLITKAQYRRGRIAVQNSSRLSSMRV